MTRISSFSKFFAFVALSFVIFQIISVDCKDADDYYAPCEGCEPMLDRPTWESEHVFKNSTRWKERSLIEKRSGSPTVSFHGGLVLQSVKAHAIFWGNNWAQSSYVSDKISSVELFFNGIGNSAYAKVDNQYYGSNGFVTSSISYSGHTVDTTSANSVLQLGDPLYNAVLSTVCKNIATPDPAGNGFYPVFTDIPRPAGASYCAWHASNYCHGVKVQFGFFWSLDGDGGCDPHDVSGQRSQGASAIVNVVAHELNEARVDPIFNGWYDSTGYETSDKCAWRYSPQNSGMVTLANNARFKLQGEWSNTAFITKTGFADGSNHLGCAVN